MGVFWEGLLSLLAAFGLALLGGLLFGRLVCPVPGGDLVVVIPVRGAGDSLERDLRGLMWLRGMGLLRCPVIIADAGLEEEGLRRAELLAGRWSEIWVAPAETFL